MEDISAKELYDQFYNDRSVSHDMGVACAKLTLPYVLRDIGSTQSDEYPNNYVRSFGAKLVSNLVGKLSNTIMPPNQPFHRLVIKEEALNAISQDNPEIRTEAEKVVSKKDEAVSRHILKSGF